jgi:hypothetical protein
MLTETDKPKVGRTATDLTDAALITSAADVAVSKADQEAARQEWAAAVAKWRAAVADREALDEDEQEDEWSDADSRADDAFFDVLNTRAPDAAAIAEKAALYLDEVHRGGGESATTANPAWLGKLMNDGWDEHAIVSLLQDAARLSGASSALWTAQPDTFDADGWLTSLQDRTGCVLMWEEVEGPEPNRITFGARGAAEAEAEFSSLLPWHQVEVRSLLARRYRPQAGGTSGMPSPSDWLGISGTGHMIRTFADMAAWQAEQEDAEKRAAARRLLRESVRRDVGLPVGLPDFEPEAFVAAARAAGLRFKLVNPLFGPDIQHQRSNDDAAVHEIGNQFCQLDAEQVDALTAYLERERAWAEAWVSGIEAETGIDVLFFKEGVGISRGDGTPEGFEAAAAALSGLTEAEKKILSVYAQARCLGDVRPEQNSRMAS